MSSRAPFIVFEGGDGAGKGTQIDALITWLKSTGRSVTTTREPGGTPLGAHIRELVLHGDYVDPRAEALLFAADRAHHIATVVRPALERGDVVVQDRYIDSSVAYQGGARDLGEKVRELSLWATRDLLPDLTVLLDIDPASARVRRGDVHDRLEREADDFHQQVRESYLESAQSDPQRYLVLDAARDRDAIAQAVRARVEQLLEGAR